MDATKTISEIVNVTPWNRKLYRNADEFWKESKELHHWYTVYRTLAGEHDDFKPDAVFYVGKSPSAYLIETKNISDEDVRRWQRFLWNQTIVPMLVVKSTTKTSVYTAYTKPQKPDSQQRIISILGDTADILELEQLWTAIEAGTIYKTSPDSFKRQDAVDSFLLANLNAAANKIAETQEGDDKQENLKFAHTFLTRLLFVCYLIERGMIKGKHFDDEKLKKLSPAKNGNQGYFLRDLFEGLSTSQKRDALCRIFARVKDRFNGSLFPEAIKQEKERYNEDFIDILNTFLQCHDLGDSQSTLGFWAYDFSVIPIETISAVYESFIGEQGKIKESLGETDSKRSSGAYYTPLHLAELTVDMALENIEKPIHKLKVFDPACGSGVFLVSLFSRMADSLRRKENYKGKKLNIDWARKAQSLLSQLYGIDINQTACHITCFSLYLALLEKLMPMDVEYLRRHNKNKKALKPLLANDSDSYKTIHHGNLFDPKLSLKEKNFDLVIGNPPWVSRHNQKDKDFLNWQKEDPSVLGPDKQIAHGFMWKTSEYLSDSGIGCLLLPTAVLLNDHTNKFQEKWFKSVTVERVINFSDLRFVLFAGADHPCVGIRFQSSTPDANLNIRYESPKTDIRSQQGGPVYVREEDIVNLRLTEILDAASNSKAPLVWKSHYWGSWRDRRLLSRLMDLPKLCDLAGEVGENKRWIKGQGMQTSGGDDNPVWWKPSTPYLDSNAKFDLAICKRGLPTVEESEIPVDTVHRPRPKCLFAGPKVLVSQGSMNMKVAFCDFTVLFRSSLQSITGKKKDADSLRFLSAVIKSDVVQYYLFHTSSNWGIERDKSLFYELLSLPFFLPEDATDLKVKQEIISAVARKIKGFEKHIKTASWFGKEQRRKEEAERIRRDIEPLIRRYYNIDKYEAMLIEDTLQLATVSFHPRQSTTNVPTLKQPENKDCIVYAQTLCEMLNNFGQGSQFKVKGDIIKGQPYSIVHIAMTDRTCRTIPISKADEKLARIFNRMKTLLQQVQGRFVFCQNLKVFDGNSLYILKPMQMRFWSRTAALNDADEIVGSIIQSQRGR